MVSALTVGTRGVNVAGQTVTNPKAQGYNLNIGDIWFRTIASPGVPLTIGTRDSLAERQDRAGSGTLEDRSRRAHIRSVLARDAAQRRGLDHHPRSHVARRAEVMRSRTSESVNELAIVG